MAHHHEHHHHEHHHAATHKLLLIVLATLLLGLAYYVEHHYTLSTVQLLMLYLLPYLLVGFGTLKEAAEGIAHGDVFNEDFLMSVATIGALAIGFLPGAETQFPEAVFVMLFFQVGELFEGYAEGKSRESITHLMDIRPDTANLLTTDAEGNSCTSVVSPDSVEVGSIVVVRPGEKIPLDGIVTEGTSALNTVALTGESLPREVGVDDEVISGCINLSSPLYIRTIKTFSESTVSKIIRLVESADQQKSKSEHFISKFAAVYTPVVVVGALLLAVVPPLVLHGTFAALFPTWLYRALMFLIVSCPCALVISVPLSFFGGIGGASRNGILVKGSNYMEALAHLRTVVFDKTGTLTQGQFSVTAIHPDQTDEHQLLHLAAHVEHFTTHPIGIALRQAFPEEATDGCQTTDVEEIAGEGITARVNGKLVGVGNSRLMERLGAQWHDCKHDTGTVIHVAIDGQYAGHIIISDQIKKESTEAIAQLRKEGITRIVMLTGDRQEVARQVADTLGIDECHAELLPADKVTHLERLLQEKPADSLLAFVGDGINDAPVLARADIGIAMGAMGSDAAIEAADVVLMDDNPLRLSTAIRLARRTTGIARQNVCFAIGVKVAVLILATLGLGTLALAVFADVGVTVLAVLNAMRTLRRTV